MLPGILQHLELPILSRLSKVVLAKILRENMGVLILLYSRLTLLGIYLAAALGLKNLAGIHDLKYTSFSEGRMFDKLVLINFGNLHKIRHVRSRV